MDISADVWLGPEKTGATVSEVDPATARRFFYREALLTLAQDLYPTDQPPRRGAAPHEAWSNHPKLVVSEDAETFPFSITMSMAPTACLAAVGATIVTHDDNPSVVWRLDQLGRWLNEFVTLVQRPGERASLEDHRKPDPRHARMVRDVLEALAQHESGIAGKPVQAHVFSAYMQGTVCATPLI